MIVTSCYKISIGLAKKKLRLHRVVYQDLDYDALSAKLHKFLVHNVSYFLQNAKRINATL